MSVFSYILNGLILPVCSAGVRWAGGICGGWNRPSFPRTESSFSRTHSLTSGPSRAPVSGAYTHWHTFTHSLFIRSLSYSHSLFPFGQCWALSFKRSLTWTRREIIHPKNKKALPSKSSGSFSCGDTMSHLGTGLWCHGSVRWDSALRLPLPLPHQLPLLFIVSANFSPFNLMFSTSSCRSSFFYFSSLLIFIFISSLTLSFLLNDFSNFSLLFLHLHILLLPKLSLHFPSFFPSVFLLFPFPFS